MHTDWITPDWPAPANVHAVMTTRAGGVSLAPFNSFNPASHVDDDPAAVAENRRLLRQQLPAEPLWLNQVHGVAVTDAVRASPHPAGCDAASPPTADASVAFHPNEVRAVLTADCLPVLFCNQAGTVVAAAHAGWRGLAAGVLEETVRVMRVPPETILVWLGAAIGPAAFEVGPEVRENFVAQHALAAIAFRPALPGTLDAAPHKWLADIYTLARIRLAQVGVEQVYGGGLCTFNDCTFNDFRFFSYRREARTGRMASLIWRE
ncbi:MAG: peptidoglycan editing factor PgeF [Pseudomonadota bacterium]|nr:peptidoglycan editing factor PgeF [Pseudomonadota bacterium]